LFELFPRHTDPMELAIKYIQLVLPTSTDTNSDVSTCTWMII